MAGKSVADAFEEWFDVDGWTETADPSPENGYDKIAVFAKNGKPTHAARLLTNGFWTSKLGPNIDLSHGLYDLVGPEYGQVWKIYRKSIAP